MINIALVTTSTSFVEVISAAGPIVTAVMMLLMGKPFHLTLVVPCLIVFLGCAFCSKADPTYTLLGFLLAAGANVPRSLKAMLQQFLMQREDARTEFSPLEVLAWTCVPSSFVMLSASLLQEGASPYFAFRSMERSQVWQLLGAILLSCANACILNSANLFVIKDLGAVGAQIVAQTKTLLVLIGGVSVLGEQVPRMEIAGSVLVMIGVFMYNDMEARFRAEGESKAESQLVLEEKRWQEGRQTVEKKQ